MDLAIFFPICTKRHPRNECPLTVIEIFSLCEGNHSSDKCPYFPSMKEVYQGSEGGMEKI